MLTVAAVDLGASSGRVILGRVGPGELHLEAVARFENRPVRTPDGLRAVGKGKPGNPAPL